MNVQKIANLNIRPTDKKINYVSQADSFQRIKDSIQVSIDKMTRG